MARQRTQRTDLSPEEELAARMANPDAFADMDAGQSPLHALALRSMHRAIEVGNQERALLMVRNARGFRQARP